MQRNKRALIFTGGSPLSAIDSAYLGEPGDFDVIIAADSGVDAAHGFGLDPHIVIGDFDSVSEAGLRRARREGAVVVEHPRDKDFTDTELAIKHAMTLGIDAMLVVNAGGGRLDHAHGVVAALANPHHSHVNVEAVIGDAHVTIVHGDASRNLPARGSRQIALHAMNGPAVGITTSGLRWNLDDETLEPWVARGVSNEMTAEVATVSLRSGALMIVQPNAHTSHPSA